MKDDGSNTNKRAELHNHIFMHYLVVAGLLRPRAVTYRGFTPGRDLADREEKLQGECLEIVAASMTRSISHAVRQDCYHPKSHVMPHKPHRKRPCISR